MMENDSGVHNHVNPKNVFDFLPVGPLDSARDFLGPELVEGLANKISSRF